MPGLTAYAGLLATGIYNLRQFGRIVLCGMISIYDAGRREPGPADLFSATARRLTLRGFAVSGHMDRRARFY